MKTSPTIIVSDPDRRMRDVLRTEFSRSDCLVLMASSNQEAEGYALRALPQMIIMDVTDQKLGGYQTCARIRHHNSNQNCPIVLTAGHILPMDLAAAKQAGATFLLAKPYSIAALSRQIRLHLVESDPLVGHLPGINDEQATNWARTAATPFSYGQNSGLARNGKILGIVRGLGTKVPMIQTKAVPPRSSGA